MNVLVLNCGSSSIKYQLLNMDAVPVVLAKGIVEKIGLTYGSFTYKPEGKDKVVAEQPIMDHSVGMDLILKALVHPDHGVLKSLNEIDAVGHRVAHGGEYFSESVKIDDEAKAKIKALGEIAPLHNPANLKGIETMEKLLPSVPQVAVFDTSFHQTLPKKAFIYGIPYEYYEEYGVRRYGFHGTSHRFVSEEAARILGWDITEKKIITCHLGNGASITAIDKGKSVDTSMGFTPVAGLVMGTRAGDLDLGALLYICEKEALNLPVAAREASIYTGLTLAEYYRDMGYHVAIMADSTSRWAEALRELSGRLEEMPAEEGFPAYLASKLSAFYERAGMMHNLNGSVGSVTIIGAVSPQGSDFSEPVTQNTKRFVRCFWGLDKSLAYARHFPAIHWLTSYSEYVQDLAPWYNAKAGKDFIANRNRLMAILNQESALMEIVKLIGSDVLPDDQKLTLEIARVVRLGYLQQNAFHKDDTCVPIEKQAAQMRVILYLYDRARSLVTMGHPMSVLKQSNIFDRVINIKYDVPNDRLDMFDQYMKDIDTFYDEVIEKNA